MVGGRRCVQRPAVGKHPPEPQVGVEAELELRVHARVDGLNEGPVGRSGRGQGEW